MMEVPFLARNRNLHSQSNKRLNTNRTQTGSIRDKGPQPARSGLSLEPMQASHKEIHAFLLEYTGASNRVQAGKFKRDQLRLEFEGGAASTAKLRDLRNTCCMIDIGSSILTLNFRDVTTFSIPNEPGTTMPVLTVRLGSLARDMNARMARDTRRSSYFERSSDRSYTQPRPAAAEAGIPLNPPGGLQLEIG